MTESQGFMSTNKCLLRASRPATVILYNLKWMSVTNVTKPRLSSNISEISQLTLE